MSKNYAKCFQNLAQCPYKERKVFALVEDGFINFNVSYNLNFEIVQFPLKATSV